LHVTPREQTRPAPLPWLEPGVETCGFCLRAYHYEAAYHCADCDRPACPVCIVTVRERQTVVCPQCAGDSR
jgi:hypothetical protein